jgi:hypothetical protein
MNSFPGGFERNFIVNTEATGALLHFSTTYAYFGRKGETGRKIYGAIAGEDANRLRPLSTPERAKSLSHKPLSPERGSIEEGVERNSFRFSGQIQRNEFRSTKRTRHDALGCRPRGTFETDTKRGGETTAGALGMIFGPM